jgi:hypothetical protein
MGEASSVKLDHMAAVPCAGISLAAIRSLGLPMRLEWPANFLFPCGHRTNAVEDMLGKPVILNAKQGAWGVRSGL